VNQPYGLYVSFRHKTVLSAEWDADGANRDPFVQARRVGSGVGDARVTLRFWRRFRIVPGVRANLSKSGLSPLGDGARGTLPAREASG
jgi:hypothetical protein